MFTPIDVSTTALIAERQRMNTIADNLANVNTTRKIYARFSPSYLKDAAAALEFDDLGSMNRKSTISRRVK